MLMCWKTTFWLSFCLISDLTCFLDAAFSNLEDVSTVTKFRPEMLFINGPQYRAQNVTTENSSISHDKWKLRAQLKMGEMSSRNRQKVNKSLTRIVSRHSEPQIVIFTSNKSITNNDKSKNYSKHYNFLTNVEENDKLSLDNETLLDLSKNNTTTELSSNDQIVILGTWSRNEKHKGRKLKKRKRKSKAFREDIANVNKTWSEFDKRFSVTKSSIVEKSTLVNSNLVRSVAMTTIQSVPVPLSLVSFDTASVLKTSHTTANPTKYSLTKDTKHISTYLIKSKRKLKSKNKYRQKLSYKKKNQVKKNISSYRSRHKKDINTKIISYGKKRIQFVDVLNKTPLKPVLPFLEKTKKPKEWNSHRVKDSVLNEKKSFGLKSTTVKTHELSQFQNLSVSASNKIEEKVLSIQHKLINNRNKKRFHKSLPLLPSSPKTIEKSLHKENSDIEERNEFKKNAGVLANSEKVPILVYPAVHHRLKNQPNKWIPILNIKNEETTRKHDEGYMTQSATTTTAARNYQKISKLLVIDPYKAFKDKLYGYPTQNTFDVKKILAEIKSTDNSDKYRKTYQPPDTDSVAQSSAFKSRFTSPHFLGDSGEEDDGSENYKYKNKFRPLLSSSSPKTSLMPRSRSIEDYPASSVVYGAISGNDGSFGWYSNHPVHSTD